jgi:hypothetical protein
MHDRTVLVLELIRNPRADSQIVEALAALGPHNGDPLAIVSRTDFISVLRQFESGSLSANELKAWANRLVGRRDIEFEFGQEGAVVEALFWLAYEELQEWANNRVCLQIESMLERRSNNRDASD